MFVSCGGDPVLHMALVRNSGKSKDRPDVYSEVLAGGCWKGRLGLMLNWFDSAQQPF